MEASRSEVCAPALHGFQGAVFSLELSSAVADRSWPIAALSEGQLRVVSSRFRMTATDPLQPMSPALLQRSLAALG